MSEEGLKKNFIQNREGLLRGGPRGSRDTAQGLETWEKLGLQQRYMFRKGKSAVEGDPKKS